jgi:diguanylate cyclase (GGDEF)-like protein
MDQTLVINVLVVSVAATIVLIVLAIVVPRLRRDRPDVTFAQPATPPALNQPTARPATVGFGAGVATMGVGREFVTAAAIPEGPVMQPQDVAGLDSLTGLVLLTTWNRLLADEDARVRRYRRPATVVMIELDGLDRLIERLGPESADRLIPAVADTIRRSARLADHVARLGHGRFGVLLPETDDVQAINYVERVRRACDLWLESGAIALRLAIGWASTTGDEGLADAQRVAGERMFAEIRRNTRRGTELTGGPVDGESDRGGAGVGGGGEPEGSRAF